MSDWRAWGSERRSEFEESLTPKRLEEDLDRYRSFFGVKFGLDEILQLRRIQALAMIAQAINDVPEFMMDQIGLEMNEPEFHRISDGLTAIAEAIEGESS